MITRRARDTTPASERSLSPGRDGFWRIPFSLLGQAHLYLPPFTLMVSPNTTKALSHKLQFRALHWRSPAGVDPGWTHKKWGAGEHNFESATLCIYKWLDLLLPATDDYRGFLGSGPIPLFVALYTAITSEWKSSNIIV